MITGEPAAYRSAGNENNFVYLSAICSYPSKVRKLVRDFRFFVRVVLEILQQINDFAQCKNEKIDNQNRRKNN